MPGIGMSSIKNWPTASREAARRVIEQYGEPDEITASELVWHKRGPWRRIVASKAIYQHNFPAPHYTLFALEPSDEEASVTVSMAAAKAAKRRSRKPAALGKMTATTTAA